jgi:hypothetical protein
MMKLDPSLKYPLRASDTKICNVFLCPGSSTYLRPLAGLNKHAFAGMGTANGVNRALKSFTRICSIF